MKLRRMAALAAVPLVALAAVAVTSSANAAGGRDGQVTEYGEQLRLGNGKLIAYSERNGARPVSIGLIMTDGVLDGLPTDMPTDGKWCFDKDGNGTVDPMTECTGG
ncbi:MAG TPA: hypothetical protein VH969_06955, partial [Actinophytocola sp.]|uniref:hypothetical protein n=1 Tax=Actinophytocola sp. TaxID=1872138 RepID=UPI002F95329B